MKKFSTILFYAGCVSVVCLSLYTIFNLNFDVVDIKLKHVLLILSFICIFLVPIISVLFIDLNYAPQFLRKIFIPVFILSVFPFLTIILFCSMCSSFSNTVVTYYDVSPDGFIHNTNLKRESPYSLADGSIKYKNIFDREYEPGTFVKETYKVGYFFKPDNDLVYDLFFCPLNKTSISEFDADKAATTVIDTFTAKFNDGY